VRVCAVWFAILAISAQAVARTLDRYPLSRLYSPPVQFFLFSMYAPYNAPAAADLAKVQYVFSGRLDQLFALGRIKPYDGPWTTGQEYTQWGDGVSQELNLDATYKGRDLELQMPKEAIRAAVKYLGGIASLAYRVQMARAHAGSLPPPWRQQVPSAWIDLWEPKIGLLIMDGGFRFWPKAGCPSFHGRVDNFHVALRAFGVDGSNTAKAFPQHGGDKLLHSDFVHAIFAGPGRVASMQTQVFAQGLAGAGHGALTVEEVRDALAGCHPNEVRKGVCGWATQTVTKDVIEEARRNSPPEGTAFVVLHPDGVDCGDLGRLKAKPPVKFLWIVAGDDCIASTHGSAGGGSIVSALEVEGARHGWRVAKARLPGNRIFHSANAVSQLLAHVFSQRLGNLFL